VCDATGFDGCFTAGTQKEPATFYKTGNWQILDKCSYLQKGKVVCMLLNLKKITFTTLLLIVPLCVLYLISCQKELKDERKQAIFTSEANGVCLGVSAVGLYFRGLPLNDSNYLRFSVNVSRTGSYDISTDTAGGIYFAASGSFETAGAQQILLKAYGVPQNAGSFNFKVINSSCSLPLVIHEPLLSFGDFQFINTGGVCNSPQINGAFIEGMNTAPSNNVTLKVQVLNKGKYVFGTDTINGIYFYGAGEFSDTGLQEIPLYAFGTPQHKGVYSYYPATTTTTCSFDITVEDPASAADYSIIAGAGDPGSCYYTVTGNYVTDLALTKANNATIAINVDKLGTYTIMTNLVNGMVFSASGTFDTKGRQVINIYGTGTPVEKGQFELTPAIFGPHLQTQDACTFQVTVF